MPMTLIRRPRSPRVLHDIIRNEVREAYRELGKKLIARLLLDIESWEGKPEFKYRIEVGAKSGRWLVSVRYDSETRIGQIYRWVDEGTGAAGGKGTEYPIVPVNADVLTFTIPNNPKSLPNVVGIGAPGIVMNSGFAEFQDVFTKKVMHPGIRPRNFTKSLKEEMKQRERPGAFRSVTEAAIKRGTRQIGKSA